MERPLIELKKVGIQFRLKGSFIKGRRSEFWAIRNISLKIHKGDKLAIIGRNGAGKSTLASVLAGILYPDEGRIKTRRIRCQRLTTNPGFDGALTGRENCVLSGMYLGKTKRQMLRVLNRIEKFSELGAFFDQPVESYSGGMRSRLGLGLALEVLPDVLIMDEFLGTAGDLAFQEKSKAAMEQVLGGGSRAIVMISHNPETLLNHCNRAVLIEGGQIIANGTVEDLLLQYSETIKLTGRNVQMKIDFIKELIEEKKNQTEGSG